MNVARPIAHSLGASVRTTVPPRARDAPVSPVAGLLAFGALTIALSALPALRPNIGGLSAHPYLFVILLLAPLTVAKLSIGPRRVVAAATAFAAVFMVALLPAGFALSEAIKLVAAMLTILAPVVLLRTQREVTLVVVCLAVAIAFISLRGLALGEGQGMGDMGGINAMKGIGNKNSFSLYALPSLLLSGWLLTRNMLVQWQRPIVVASMLVITAAVFSSANRSGWIGVVFVGLMLLSGRLSLRTLLLIGVTTTSVYLYVGQQQGTRVMLQRRMDQTVGSNDSDERRKELVTTSFRIAAENPLLGVGPQRLPMRLGRALGVPPPGVEPHNVFAYVAGGCGFPAMAAFMALLGSLAFPWRHTNAMRLCPSRWLPLMMTMLWMFRGLFTHEILFSPTFAMGLGVSIALLTLERQSLPTARIRLVHS